MKQIIFFLVVTLFTMFYINEAKSLEHLSGQNLVNYINSKQNLWKAEKNDYFDSMTKEMKSKFFGALKTPASIKAKNTKYSINFDGDVPESFDARKNWPQCISIDDIRDQSSCGSCWAFGAVEAISDRICIASNGTLQVMISARDLLSCCDDCGYGCEGGYPYAAWEYWTTEGIVSGSDFVEDGGCQPYPFAPCGHHVDKSHTLHCPKDLYPTPTCQTTCKEGYRYTYKQDKFVGKKFYSLDNNEELIRKEIMQFGPVEAAFQVYSDFVDYKSGIYKHEAGELLGGHAVKIIGWGVENSVKYWTVANSWNSDWGENGYFRILRGADECGIESECLGGIP